MDPNTNFSGANHNSLRGLIAALWFLCGTRGVFQNDTWWHLATGRYIWDSRSFPTVDSFSWVTSPGTYWPNHEWLSELIMFTVYSNVGSLGLHLLIGFVFAAAALFTWHSIGSAAPIKFVVMLLLLPWLATGSAVRPHVATLLFNSGLLFILTRRKHFVLPALFLVWAQLHGGVCLGGAILMVWCAGTAIFNRKELRPLALWTLSSGAIVVINPIGFDLYVHPLRSTAVSRTLPLIEWASPFSIPVLGHYYLILCALFLIGGVAAVRISPSRETWILSLVVVVLLPLTFIHARTVSLLVPLLSLGGISIAERFLSNKVAGVSLPHTLLKILAAVTVLYGGISASSVEGTPAEQPISEQGIREIQRTPENLFNSYDTGGYLIWFVPDRKVFIDSRQDPYPQQLLLEAIGVQRSGEYTQFFANFQFRSAIIERHFPLHANLLRAGWKIRYRSPLFDLLVAPGAN